MPAHFHAANARRYLALTCLGVATVATPLAALAHTAAAPMAQPGPRTVSMSHHAAYTARRETLDQRIGNMHAALKITPAEEADWSKVADVMRHNDGDMQKMIADRQARVPHELSAVDELKTYQSFTQAHVDSLKDLVAAFETLYAAMPEDQKLIADHVFAKYGRARNEMHNTTRIHS